MHVYQEARLAGRVSQGLPRLKILLIRYCMCMRIMLGVVSMQIHGQCTPSWPQLGVVMQYADPGTTHTMPQLDI